LYQHLFHLHGEDIDSLDDEHIVATAFDAVYTDVGTSARALAGQDAGKVACTVAETL
jgi:hypothetical protein